MDTRLLCTRLVTALALLLAGATTCALAADAMPRHDPFARPKLAAEAPALPPPTPAAEWRPHLSAIVAAGARSMVQLDSTVVELGEEIDGFRLVSVTEKKAIFAKGRRRVELTIGNERADTP